MVLFERSLVDKSTKTGILTLNSHGVVLSVNDEYLTMTDFSEHALLGKSLSSIDPHAAAQIPFGNLDDLLGHYHSVLSKKNGECFPTEGCFFTQKREGETRILLFIKDVSHDNQIKSNLSIIEKIFQQSNEAIMLTDNRGVIHTVNPSFTEITGYSPSEVIGKTPAVLNSGKQDAHFYSIFWSKLIKDGYWHGEIWNKRKNGEIYPEWVNISNIRNKAGDITNYICQFTDITKRKKSEEEQHFYAYHDTLTNLPNRNYLFEKLKYLCTLNEEHPLTFVVLFCDLDRFKLINDSLGHEVGDELLKAVAKRFHNKLRDNDIIARSGGDEFIVVIEGEKAIKNLNKICQQILALFNKPFLTSFGEFNATISIGASTFPDDSLNIRELISFADVAMSKIKEIGGNNYSFFDIREKNLIMQRLDLEREIANAIENKHFEVWYQPQINTDTNKVYGVECLLRWNHPEQGLISPNLFIPIAEANGSIKELGHFVLQTACRQLRLWRLDNVFSGVMAINVSLRQFDRNDLLTQVRDVLVQEMVPGDSIELEVTESLFSDGNQYYSPVLSELRELGVKVAIDDFGTGYSSLQRLKSLPIDDVKVDKCFIDNIEHSIEDTAILEALIVLSKVFDFSLIAEGVERVEQAEKLKSLGCFNHQGFLYSKPLRAHDFEEFLGHFTKLIKLN